MPIVKIKGTGTVHATVDLEVYDECKDYAEWSTISVDRIVEVALKRLFEQDREWQTAKIGKD